MGIALLALASCSTIPSGKNLKKAASYNASLGSQYLNTGDLKKAREKLLKALRQDNKNAQANFSYGLLLARVEQYEEAETFLLNALELSPDEAHFHDTYGIFLCTAKRYEEAMEEFATSADNPFNEAPEYAYNNAGSCALGAGQLNLAETNTRQALRNNPKFPPALLNMAEIMLSRHKAHLADAYYQRYTKYSQATADSLWLGVRIKRQLGDRPSADEYGQQLKRTFPQSAEALRYLESKSL